MYVAPHLNGRVHECITNACDEFLHIEPIYERTIEEQCACHMTCIRKSVTCVACVFASDGTLKTTRIFKNSHSKRHGSVHAEHFLIQDASLRASFEKDARLMLYMTYQPCHFSGGHFTPSRVSCTESLLLFSNNILKPLNMSLTIKISQLYRVYWRQHHARYDPMVRNANLGLRLLQSDCEIGFLEERDIIFLSRFFSPSERERYVSGAFTEIIAKRSQLLEKMNELLITTSKGDSLSVCRQCQP